LDLRERENDKRIDIIKDAHTLYFSSVIIRKTESSNLKWAGHVACMRARRNAHSISSVKPEGNVSLGGYA
jgi:hypothetical protein